MSTGDFDDVTAALRQALDEAHAREAALSRDLGRQRDDAERYRRYAREYRQTAVDLRIAYTPRSVWGRLRVAWAVLCGREVRPQAGNHSAKPNSSGRGR